MKFFIQINILLIGVIICTSCLNHKKENPTVSDTLLSEEKIETPNNNTLELEEVIEIKLEYIGLMCPCPQWAAPENIELYYSVLGTKNEFSMDSVFMILERKNDSITFPFKMEGWEGEKVFIFKGQFYKNRRKWTGGNDYNWNSRVFRYESYKIASKN